MGRSRQAKRSNVDQETGVEVIDHLYKKNTLILKITILSFNDFYKKSLFINSKLYLFNSMYSF